MRFKNGLFLLLIPGWLFAQRPFGHTTAIPADSSVIVSWATSCEVIRGWQNLSDTLLGKTNLGSELSALGKAGLNGVVSLGDGGSATLQFESHLYNGNGPDFAVFENGFGFNNDTTFYLELAFVEVSSDGHRFVRFPSRCDSDTLIQKNTFYGSNPEHIHNLAGKFVSGYGTPFDLEDLRDSSGIDINRITHIRILDVVGSLNDTFAQRDQRNVLINDPWPTPFPSCGFDLDAVAALHLATGLKEFTPLTWSFYPNPIQADDLLTLRLPDETLHRITICDMTGKQHGEFFTGGMQPKIKTTRLHPGQYLIRVDDSKPLQLIIIP